MREIKKCDKCGYPQCPPIRTIRQDGVEICHECDLPQMRPSLVAYTLVGIFFGTLAGTLFMYWLMVHLGQ